MKSLPTVKERIPRSDGIFSRMDYDFGDGVNKSYLDVLFRVYWGDRNTSQLVETFDMEEETGELTSTSMSEIASILLMLYKPKWDKLKTVYSLEYDPVHNYLDEWEDTAEKTEEDDTTTTRTNDLTDTRTINLSDNVLRTNNLTDTRTDNLSSNTERTDNLLQETDSAGNNSTNNNVFGFNSSSAVPSESESSSNSDNQSISNTGSQSTSVTNTGTQQTIKTGTVTDAITKGGTDTLKSTGTRTDVLDGSKASTQDRNGRHFGNIGNITSQSMILEEIRLWQWNFIEEVLRDVKKELTLPIYLG